MHAVMKRFLIANEIQTLVLYWLLKHKDFYKFAFRISKIENIKIVFCGVIFATFM